jgi:hypothetical protein
MVTLSVTAPVDGNLRLVWFTPPFPSRLFLIQSYPGVSNFYANSFGIAASGFYGGDPQRPIEFEFCVTGQSSVEVITGGYSRITLSTNLDLSNLHMGWTSRTRHTSCGFWRFDFTLSRQNSAEPSST